MARAPHDGQTSGWCSRSAAMIVRASDARYSLIPRRPTGRSHLQLRNVPIPGRAATDGRLVLTSPGQGVSLCPVYGWASAWQARHGVTTLTERRAPGSPPTDWRSGMVGATRRNAFEE